MDDNVTYRVIERIYLSANGHVQSGPIFVGTLNELNTCYPLDPETPDPLRAHDFGVSGCDRISYSFAYRTADSNWLPCDDPRQASNP